MKDLFCFKSRKRFTLFRENSLTGVTVFLLITLLTILFVNPIYADTGLQTSGTRHKTQDLQHRVAKLNIPFILNQGQTDEKVKFYVNTFSGTVFVTKEGEIVYSIPKNEKPESPSPLAGEGQGEGASTKGIALKEEFLNANIKEINGEDKPLTKVNYFKGDKTSWKTNIPTYETVNLGEIYKGIELNLKAYGNNVEKLFYVKPNTNPEKIKVKLNGADNLNVNEDGELEVKTELGIIKFTKPVAYQEIDGKRDFVDVTYTLTSTSTYSFKLGDYDKTKELVIDPLLASTFLGGSGYDAAHAIAIDQSDNVYVTGITGSQDFPTTPGVYDTTRNGSYDVFISKLNSDLTQLLASTFVGGNSGDYVHALAIDTSGNVYITGATGSADFPTTPGAYDATYNGANDVFISKLNSDLTQLLASTFIGGSGSEYIMYDFNIRYSMTIDTSGNVYIAGGTGSADFPTTPGAYDTTHNGSFEVFISKLNSDLTQLLASTFLDGSQSSDYTSSIAIDQSGNVYVAGLSGYAVSNVFVSKLNSDLTQLLASTFLGGATYDWGDSIAIDTLGNVYVTGDTVSSDFPTTPGAYDRYYS